jgi:hypothetical protein
VKLLGKRVAEKQNLGQARIRRVGSLRVSIQKAHHSSPSNAGKDPPFQAAAGIWLPAEWTPSVTARSSSTRPGRHPGSRGLGFAAPIAIIRIQHVPAGKRITEKGESRHEALPHTQNAHAAARKPINFVTRPNDA